MNDLTYRQSSLCTSLTVQTATVSGVATVKGEEFSSSNLSFLCLVLSPALLVLRQMRQWGVAGESRACAAAAEH
jgi:hypothetical protein